ncbi:hypothetical protein PIROE2DRAFT_3838 [Piromyces sp. E2]|nr:hypothetical protein PIROE2DRAFT_3838 [Piromyces sp. E2]|eukprot:OUM68396.1 hypothetical protein PIROE2DRAFT_3838 [Piromyces sp. E2]
MSVQLSNESLFAEEKIESINDINVNCDSDEEEKVQSISASYENIKTEDKTNYIQESLTELMNKSQSQNIIDVNKKSLEIFDNTEKADVVNEEDINDEEITEEEVNENDINKIDEEELETENVINEDINYDSASNALSKSKSGSIQSSSSNVRINNQNRISKSNIKLNKNENQTKKSNAKLNINNDNTDNTKSDINNMENEKENNSNDENDENNDKKEEIIFPDTGTKDIYDNFHELHHQIQFLKKQLKIEEMLFDELINLKTLNLSNTGVKFIPSQIEYIKDLCEL